MSSSRGLRFIGRLSKTFMNFLLNLAASRDDALASSTANRGAKDGSTWKELAKSWGAFFEVSPWRNFRSNCLSQKVEKIDLLHFASSLLIYWIFIRSSARLGRFHECCKNCKKAVIRPDRNAARKYIKFFFQIAKLPSLNWNGKYVIKDQKLDEYLVYNRNLAVLVIQQPIHFNHFKSY